MKSLAILLVLAVAAPSVQSAGWDHLNMCVSKSNGTCRPACNSDEQEVGVQGCCGGKVCCLPGDCVDTCQDNNNECQADCGTKIHEGECCDGLKCCCNKNQDCDDAENTCKAQCLATDVQEGSCCGGHQCCCEKNQLCGDGGNKCKAQCLATDEWEGSCCGGNQCCCEKNSDCATSGNICKVVCDAVDVPAGPCCGGQQCCCEKDSACATTGNVCKAACLATDMEEGSCCGDNKCCCEKSGACATTGGECKDACGANEMYNGECCNGHGVCCIPEPCFDDDCMCAEVCPDGTMPNSMKDCCNGQKCCQSCYNDTVLCECSTTEVPGKQDIGPCCDGHGIERCYTSCDFCKNGGGTCVAALNGMPNCPSNQNYTVGRCCDGENGEHFYCCADGPPCALVTDENLTACLPASASECKQSGGLQLDTGFCPSNDIKCCLRECGITCNGTCTMSNKCQGTVDEEGSKSCCPNEGGACCVGP